MGIAIDLTNRVFGQLTALSLSSINPRRWLCRCTCGNTKVIKQSGLISGRTLSCRCLYRKSHGAHHSNPCSAYEHDQCGIYKRGACKRGLEWRLSLDQFLEIIKAPCSYCGEVPVYPNHHANRLQSTGCKRYRAVFAHHGIDRVDNLAGYTPENSVSCCKICNFAKGKLTSEEFKTWIIKVKNHLHL